MKKALFHRSVCLIAAILMAVAIGLPAAAHGNDEIEPRYNVCPICEERIYTTIEKRNEQQSPCGVRGHVVYAEYRITTCGCKSRETFLGIGNNCNCK